MPRRKLKTDMVEDMADGGAAKQRGVSSNVIPVADVSMLNIFEGGPVELSIDSYQDFMVFPMTFYEDDASSPITFMINSSEHFLDLYNMRVEVWFRILKSDNSNLGEPFLIKTHLLKNSLSHVASPPFRCDT
jgi:hypothetical protein